MHTVCICIRTVVVLILVCIVLLYPYVLSTSYMYNMQTLASTTTLCIVPAIWTVCGDTTPATSVVCLLCIVLFLCIVNIRARTRLVLEVYNIILYYIILLASIMHIPIRVGASGLRWDPGGRLTNKNKQISRYPGPDAPTRTKRWGGIVRWQRRWDPGGRLTNKQYAEYERKRLEHLLSLLPLQTFGAINIYELRQFPTRSFRIPHRPK